MRCVDFIDNKPESLLPFETVISIALSSYT